MPHLGCWLAQAGSQVALNNDYLLLQLEDTVHQRLACRRASRHIDVHWNDSVATSCNTVAVVIVPASVCTATHTDNPSGVGHLIVHLPEGRRHLVRERSSNYHDVGLARRCSEDDTEAILIVTGCGKMHHLDGAASESERHGPQR